MADGCDHSELYAAYSGSPGVSAMLPRPSATHELIEVGLGSDCSDTHDGASGGKVTGEGALSSESCE